MRFPSLFFRAWARCGVVVASLIVGPAAHADVRLDVTPMFGPEVRPGQGWSPVVVRVENATAAPLRGTLEIRDDATGPQTVLPLRTPYQLAPGETSLLSLPLYGCSGQSLVATAWDDQGQARGTETFATGEMRSPLLIDAHVPSKLAVALRGAKVPVRTTQDGFGPRNPPVLAFGAVTTVPITGEPLLPERAIEYGSATLLVFSTDLVTHLHSAQLDALAGYVLAGGNLALVVTSPDDLRSRPLLAMIGGEAHYAPASSALFSEPDRGRPGELAPRPGAADDDDDDSRDAPEPVTPPEPVRRLPSAALQKSLVGFTGGNLAPSEFGATAAYGLGEVHLLAFDPSRTPAIDDPWAQARLVELVRHAWDRRSSLVFPLGGADPPGWRAAAYDDIRRHLDPNETTHWTVWAAAAFLLLYAIATPLHFAVTRRGRQPIHALRNLTVLSTSAFCLLVALGLSTRSCRGEARRVSLTEAGAGMTTGNVRKFRSLFTSRPRAVTVQPAHAEATVTLADEPRDATYSVHANHVVQLENVTLLPWQATLVREDDWTPLGGGVSLRRGPSGDVAVTNRVGRSLRGVLVQAPERGVYYFPLLKDGESVLASAGKLLTRALPPPSARKPAGGSVVVHALQIENFATELDRSDPLLSTTWAAVAMAARARAVDWWPPGLPVLLAMIEGGENLTSDSGYPLTRDHSLLRVTGYGGSP